MSVPPSVVVALLVAGCGRIGFGTGGDAGEHLGGGDGEVIRPDVPACTFGPWETPVRIAEASSAADDWDMALHPDGRTVVFSRQSPDFDLYLFDLVDRAPPAAIPGLATSGRDESGPAWSPDGRTLYVTINTGGSRLHTVAFDGVTFGTPALVSELATVSFLGAHVTATDTELLFTDNMFAETLRRSTRAAAGEPWSPPEPATELNAGGTAGYPTTTPDALTIYFDSRRGPTRQIWQASRASVGEAWNPPTLVPELDGDPAPTADPELSRDGRTMLFSSGRGSTTYDLWMITRPCD